MRYLVLTCLSACITVRAVTVDKKSTLEQQFIGEYEELTDDLATMASVRSQSTGLGADGSDPYARALQARRIQAFYKADLDRARVRGCVGEASDGRVKALACTDAGGAADPKVERLVGMENTAREALVDYALSKNAQLKDADRALLWQAYRRIVLASLSAGAMEQSSAGQWVPHAK